MHAQCPWLCKAGDESKGKNGEWRTFSGQKKCCRGIAWGDPVCMYVCTCVWVFCVYILENTIGF